MSLRILIADDESPARARLRGLVEELGHEVCAEAPDGLAVERLLRDVHPDAMLLDIHMPGTDGLTLARRMEAEHPEVPVVLVTAHAEHAVAAFDADVRDYVLKPVRRERLERALGRLRGARTKEVPRIRVKIGRREQLVPLDEIDCFVAEDGYVMARSARVEGFVDSSLQELEKRLAGSVLRVHRGCLVVKSAVSGAEARGNGEHFVLFRDGLDGIRVSRRRVAEINGFVRVGSGLQVERASAVRVPLGG
ncbi:MAG: LytR/AlgR family response regulator transcription factor [Pseudomonadota bacterium]